MFFYLLRPMYKEFITEFEKSVLQAGRSIEEIELVAVSKKKPLSDIIDVYNAGQLSFGENQIQEIEAKWVDFKKENPEIKLHFVGAIQSRKTNSILENCDVIHSIDRLKIVKLIKKYEESNRKKRQYFLQINTGNEPQKSGVLLKDADVFIDECKNIYNLDISGLMCLPPLNEDPVQHFKTLKILAENHRLSSLSMGMSHDYQEAIRCGATHIRIGTSIFGKRS